MNFSELGPNLSQGLEMPAVPEAGRIGIDVIRIVPLTLAPFASISEQLQKGIPIGEIPLTGVVLAEKSAKSLTSFGLTMCLGGKVKPGETLVESAHRKMRYESQLVSCGASLQLKPIESAYSYTIKGKPGSPEDPDYQLPRQVSFLPIPVLPTGYTGPEPRHAERVKIKRFMELTPDQFRELVNQGTVQLPPIAETGQAEGLTRQVRAAGHITKQSEEDIEILPEEEVKKNQTLDTLVGIVGEFERRVRDELLLIANAGLVGEDKKTSLDEFSSSELIEALQRLQLEWLLVDERYREANHLSRPPAGFDLLRFAWFSTDNGIALDNMSRLLFESPTRNLRDYLRVTVMSFREALYKVESGVDKVSPEEPPVNFGKEAVKSRSQILHELSLFRLREKFTAMTALERSMYIRELETEFQRELCRKLGVDSWVLAVVRGEVDSFFEEIVAQSMSVNPDFGRIFQPNKVVPEVVNSEFSRLFLLSLGLNPLDPEVEYTGSYVARQVPYEALRHLAMVFKGVEVYKRYQQLLDNGNAPVEALLNELFSPASEEDVRIVEERIVTERRQKTTFSVGGKLIEVDIDEKPPKPFPSFLRKAFFEPLVDIRDVFSLNITLQDSPDEFQPKSAVGSLEDEGYYSKKIGQAKLIFQQIQDHVAKAAEQAGWLARFVGVKDSFDRLEMQQDDLVGQEQATRPGMKAANIIRAKMYIVLTDPQGREYNQEICVYPFENFKNTPYEEILWGHDEKIYDDAVGGYSHRRLMEPEPGYEDLLPLMFILFPPHLYPHHREALWLSNGNGGKS